jgi:hypothetical protein
MRKRVRGMRVGSEGDGGTKVVGLRSGERDHVI